MNRPEHLFRVALIAIVFTCSLLQSCQGKGHFKCPGENKTCFCYGRVIECSSGVSVEVDHNDNIMKFQCGNRTANLGVEEIAASLPEFNVGDISRVQFIKCTLPEGKSVLKYLGSIHHSRLQSLDFVSGGANKNNSISNEHFEGFGDLKMFELGGHPNELGTLPPDFFKHMTKLTSVTIKVQNIHLPDNLFAPLLELEHLNLKDNKLSSLSPGFFGNQNKLKTLELAGNSLKALPNETFMGVGLLEKLGLTYNKLEVLESGVFFHMTQLTDINLSGNNFTSLPDRLFSNNKNLSIFSLIDNQIPLEALPNGLLANLSLLKEVHINCSLKTIPAGIFKGSNNIETIVLKGNNLVNLLVDLFVDQSKLIKLDLSENLIQDLQDGIFKNQASLKELKLSKNSLKRISEDLLLPLHGLEYLYLNDNQLHQIRPDAFMALKKMTRIFLQNNQLQNFNNSPFQELATLKSINLAHNRLTQVFRDLTLLSLESLDLSYNALESFSIANLSRIVFARNLSLDISHNNISTFDFNVTAVKETRIIQITMTGNPLSCDCRIHSLVKHLQNPYKENPEKINVVIDNLRCAGPSTMVNKLVAFLNSSELLCPVEENCPDGCECAYRKEDNFLKMDCGSLRGTFKENFRQLQSTFDQIELRMENKNLTTLPDFSSESFQNIKKLFVRGNKLSNITLNNLPKNVEVIELHNNSLITLNRNVIGFFKNHSMTLSNNAWGCDCSDWAFINFAQNHRLKITDYHEMSCSDKNRTFSSLTKSDICFEDHKLVLVLCIACAIAGLSLSILAALYFKYKEIIKLWMYSHNVCFWWVTEEDVDKDKLFDAFVSYSHQDEDFVEDHLWPGLESIAKPYKLCLHKRDWSPGVDIGTQISDSVNDSRRIIIVMSPSYLESNFGQYEFRVARSHVIVERRERIIVIMYKDIGDIENLQPEIRDYLRMNTYVTWGDNWFWERLRDKMPRRCRIIQNDIEMS